MIANIFDYFRGRKPAVAPPERQKLFANSSPSHIYAIGDVHGCDALLERLLDRIVADSHHRQGSKCLIMLGDYVDRGSSSAAVIYRLMTRPPQGLRLFCLAGNHEDVMLDFLQSPTTEHRWLDFGGVATLHSYGIHKLPSNTKALKELLQTHIPEEHVGWLKSLPSMIALPGHCFVHAGLRSDVDLTSQRDSDLLWIRPTPASRDICVEGRVTVHGHTPVEGVEIWPARINVDTGAYMTGLLSAVRISAGEAPAVIDTR